MPAEWSPPSELPDLRNAGIVAVDTETKDGGLLAGRGSSWPWGDGYICGISVAYPADGGVRSHYFPLRHPDTDNFDPARVFAWLKDLVASSVRIVTQNGLYDYGWLRTDGGILMPSGERIEEIGALAVMVDENRHSYGLDALCAWRGLPGKDTRLIDEAVAALLPPRRKVKNPKPVDPRPYIWRLPAHLVGPYAEQDAAATLALFDNLEPILDREGTREAYRLECGLLPMVLEMQRRGLRIDVDAAERAREMIRQKRDAALAELGAKLGAPASMKAINSPKWLAQTFNELGIEFPLTEKGNPSFSKDWMPNHAHWAPQLITRTKKCHHAAEIFIGKHVLEQLADGRVYACIHPHRSDDGGTVSFLFSYSDPPLQQMPKHDAELAPLIRAAFLPEDGEVWCTPDVSQQEFRLIVHYAAQRNLPGAREAMERYRSDPTTDFHGMASEITGLVRTRAKAVNFAIVFGAGLEKLAAMIGVPLEEARVIMQQYNARLPCPRALSEQCKHEAIGRGYTILYDGARRHWSRWGLASWRKGDKGPSPCERSEAVRRAGDAGHLWYRQTLRRVGTHTALNALIQGSAARHTKLWMHACWREGIVPLLQMHDALECSVSSPEQAELVARLGCEAVTLGVPMRVDLAYGRSWGDATHTSWADLHSSGQTATAPHMPPSQTPVEPPVAVNGTHILPPPSSAAIVTDGLNDEPPWRRIPLAALIDQPLRNGKICCPFHDDPNPSCHIYNDHFHCFGCGAHGDAIDWLREVEGLSFQAALDALACWTPRPATECKGAVETLELARKLWDAAQPIAGTRAADYLAHRLVDIDQLPNAAEAALRFHPHCLFGDGVQPCLLASFRDIDSDAFAGIHRIALTAGAFASDGVVERRTLGRWSGRRAVKLWPAPKRVLVLGEGIETVAAAATRVRHKGRSLQPAWALVSAGAVARCGPVANVECAAILADNDEPGRHAAQECVRRWNDGGRKAAVLTPCRDGEDFNDLVRERASHE